MYKFIFSIIAFLLIYHSNGTAQSIDPIPVHDSLKCSSKILNEDRIINIWLPEEYIESELSFPVLYMLDGGIKEDFPHIANTISGLIQTKKIKPIILVGIENIQRRKDLTPPTSVEKDKEVAPIVGGSNEFRRFITEELIPEINQKYRTTSEKGIIGESLAGLFITETFLMNPDIFDFYIAFDPSLWWNEHQLVKDSKDYLAKFSNQSKRFWFAGSKAKDISKFTKQLAENLETNSNPSLIWKYSDEPKEKHNTIFRATKEKALIWTLNSK